MRICYISLGTSIHTKRWLNYFARRGHEVHLIASTFPAEYEGYDPSIEMHPLARLFPQIWKLSGPISGIFWLLQVRRIINRIEPDVLDAHYVGIPGYLAIASGFHPFALNAWGTDILVNAKKSPLQKHLIKYALKKADLVTCTSSLLKEAIVDLGITPDKVKVAFLGVDTRKFSPGQKDEALMQELGIVDSPVVISTRLFKPIYDLETLIKAIPLVLQEIPETKFLFAGYGEQHIYLERLASDLKIAGSIRFVGEVPHDILPRYLTTSDVYVSTSLSDGTPQSLLEAMASGLAPVVSDIPPNRLWIRDGENGYLFPLGDHKSLADRITYLLKKSEVRRAFGSANREIAKEKAEYEKRMADVERMYQELVQ